MQQGIRWRVGDGENIKVWSDPWIPNSTGLKTLQGHIQINPQLRVSDLIDQHHHIWNIQDLHHHFCPNGINSILSIPISSTGNSDKVIWHYTNLGKYEERFDYHLAKSLANSIDPRTKKPQASGQSFPKSFWTFLWSLKIKNKYKHFLRKCILNVLPVCANISKRLHQNCDVCRSCGLETETVDHMFFSWPKAQLVWKLAPINWPNVENVMNFVIRWNDLFCNTCRYPESIELLRLSVSLLWKMWKA